MQKQDLKLKSAACTAISVKWRLFGTNPTEPMQAPASIQSLYHDDILFVYGFVPHCTQVSIFYGLLKVNWYLSLNIWWKKKA